MKRSKTIYADDSTEKVSLLLRLRLPWLIVGAMFGALTTLMVSRFEKVLSSDVRLAFFIPLIVYLSDAVGTQTQTIFVRNLSKGAKFSTYLFKEFILGVILGCFFGITVGVGVFMWLGNYKTALTVGLAMSLSVASATIIALVVPVLLKQEHQDPAIGAGPFTTVIQDLVSLMIYFLIASSIILS